LHREAEGLVRGPFSVTCFRDLLHILISMGDASISRKSESRIAQPAAEESEVEKRVNKQLEASASSGRAGRCFWAFLGRFDPCSWTLS
jgi:hypothetical protein